MTVTKDKTFIASIVMSAAFFLFGNGPTADAQNGKLFSQDTGGATQKTYSHPERGEVLLGDLRFGVAGPPTRQDVVLDPRLSILVSDVDTTKQIKFSEVMDQLVKQGGDSSLTKLDLFRQWWDTAGEKPGLGLGPHCDDESPPDKNGFSTLNGFPYRCPRPEQSEASASDDPFNESSPAGYSAIAFSNRFDLIRRDWSDCGEYRIVFARNSGMGKKSDGRSRNLINFEARVPNPEPTNGVMGCRPILDFWHGLSDTSISASDRGKKLHDFYLNGLPGGHVGPVVDIANYGARQNGTGQIRTNQFLFGTEQMEFSWTLREFKAVVSDRLRIVPDTAKTMPGTDLFFRCGLVDPRVNSLILDIQAQIGKLLGAAGPANGVTDFNSIGFSISRADENAFEGDEWDGDPVKGDVRAAFVEPCVNGTPNAVLSQSIQDALTAAGSPLKPINIVNRIRTQTCAGCHHYSGNETSGGLDDLGGGATWPPKAAGDAKHRMDFTQVSEREVNMEDNPKRYGISSALEKFLVYREAFMKCALGVP